MKKLIMLVGMLAVFAGCSNDDSPDTSSDNVFLPLVDGKYWTYDVSGTGISTRDSLYVKNDTVISGTTYKKMKARAIPVGFYSTMLNNNGVRKVNSSLVVKGEAGLNFADMLPIDFSLNDFVIFRENATDGQELSSISGTIQQTIQGYPLSLDYTYKSQAMGSLASYTSPNGDTYSDVKAAKIILSLKISTSVNVFGVNVNVPILDTQDVVASEQYYAKNIGMVHAKTTISYNLEDFSQFGVTLPFPTSMSEVQQEYLDTYVAD